MAKFNVVEKNAKKAMKLNRILCVYNVSPYFVSYSIPISSYEADDNIENNVDNHNKNIHSMIATVGCLYCYHL